MEDPRTEPSMEDILASIKRIIADDAPGADRADDDTRTDAHSDAEDDAEIDARVDTDAKAARNDEALPALLDGAPAADPVSPDPVTPEPAPAAAVFTPAVSSPGPVTAVPPPAPAATPSPAAALVSENAASASRQSLSALSAMVVRPASGDLSLEGLVRDMLRPMLTEWLDASLPGIVEKLVAREIARITAQQA